MFEEKRKKYVKLLEEAVERIKEVLPEVEGVERVSIFGSYAKGRRDLFTDLDVLVVMRTRDGFVERLKKLYSLLCVPVDMDLVCYTPEEFEKMKREGNPFVRKILEEEVVLYEKKSG